MALARHATLLLALHLDGEHGVWSVLTVVSGLYRRIAIHALAINGSIVLVERIQPTLGGVHELLVHVIVHAWTRSLKLPLDAARADLLDLLLNGLLLALLPLQLTSALRALDLVEQLRVRRVQLVGTLCVATEAASRSIHPRVWRSRTRRRLESLLQRQSLSIIVSVQRHVSALIGRIVGRLREMDLQA